jgi:hypothetical protein
MPSEDDEPKQFNQALIAEFRANAGSVSGWPPLLLLTTIGARRGQLHTTYSRAVYARVLCACGGWLGLRSRLLARCSPQLARSTWWPFESCTWPSLAFPVLFHP